MHVNNNLVLLLIPPAILCAIFLVHRLTRSR